jgi:hypothetical protein
VAVVVIGAARGVVLAVDAEAIVEDLEAEEVAEVALGVSLNPGAVEGFYSFAFHSSVKYLA